MKKRLIIYSVLLVLAAGTFYYVRVNKQLPTGRAGGYGEAPISRDPGLPISHPHVRGKIYGVTAFANEEFLRFSVTGSSREFRCPTDSPIASVVQMAFISETDCTVEYYNEWDTSVVQIAVHKDEKEPSVKEKLESMDRHIRHYHKFIWSYVWETYRKMLNLMKRI